MTYDVTASREHREHRGRAAWVDGSSSLSSTLTVAAVGRRSRYRSWRAPARREVAFHLLDAGKPRRDGPGAGLCRGRCMVLHRADQVPEEPIDRVIGIPDAVAAADAKWQ